jgi:hypothetical protein
LTVVDKLHGCYKNNNFGENMSHNENEKIWDRFLDSVDEDEKDNLDHMDLEDAFEYLMNKRAL